MEGGGVMYIWILALLLVSIMLFFIIYRLNESCVELNWFFKLNLNVPIFKISIENDISSKKTQKKEPGTAIPDTRTKK